MSSKAYLKFKTEQEEIHQSEVEEILRGYQKDYIELYGASMQGYNEPKYVSIDLSGLADFTNFRSLKLNGFQYLTEMSLCPLARLKNVRSIDVTVCGLLSMPWDITPLFESLQHVSEDDPVYFQIGSDVSTWLDTNDFWGFTRGSPYKIKYKPLENIQAWEPIHTQLEVVKGRTSHITAQTSVLNGLSLGQYGLLEKDLLELILEIPPDTSIENVKRTLEPVVIETMCDQVETGRSTVGIVINDNFLENAECARLSKLILEIRQEEMERIKLPVLRNRPQWDTFLYTAYGYEILKNLDRKIVNNYSKQNVQTIFDAFKKSGFTVHTLDFSSRDEFKKYQSEVICMSEEMKKHIQMSLGLFRN